MFPGGLRVLDLTTADGAFCGRMLSMLGADVIKVEPPGGDPERNRLATTEPDLEWVAHNTGKRSVILDLDTASGVAVFLDLVATVDAVLESFSPGRMQALGLGYSILRDRNAKIVLTSITPFGQDGPYASYAGTDLVLMALGGLVQQNGDPDRAPLRFSVPQVRQLAGSQAAAATLIAYEAAQTAGHGQQVDVSMQESVLAADFVQQHYWDILEENPPRTGGVQVRAQVRMRMVFPCADGYVAWRLMFGAHGYMTQALVSWLENEGESAGLEAVDWSLLDLLTLSQADIDHYESAIGAFFNRRTKNVLYKGSLDRGIVLFPVSDASDLLGEEQFAYREFWYDLDQPLLGKSVVVPGRPFLTGETRTEPAPLPAPLPGQHNDAIVAALEAP